MSKGPLRYLGQILLLAAAFFLAGKLGLAVTSYAKGNAGLIWPPAGLALAALLLYGSRLWPGVAIGGFLVNLSTGTPIAGALAVALGNTVEAVLGFVLLRRLARFEEAMGRVRDVVALFAFGFFAAAAAGSAVSTAGLFATGHLPSVSRLGFGFHWWFGDALSTIVVAPALLVWARRPGFPRSAGRAAEAAGLLAGVVLSSLAVFGGWIPAEYSAYPNAFLVFPFVIGAAMRFGQPGATSSNLIAAAIAVAGTARGYGPFAGGDLNNGVLFLGAFLAVLALTSLIVAAETTERRTTENALRRSDDELRVRARQQAAVAELGQLALAENHFETLLGRAVDVVGQTLGSDFAGVLEIQPDGETLLMKAGWGWDLSRPHALKLDFRTHAGLTLLGGEPTIIEDLRTDPRVSASPFLAEAGVVSGISVVVPTHGRPYGLLGAHTRTPRTFTRDDINFLRAVSVVLGDAIDRRERDEALERSERHFRSLIESALDVITITDVQGTSIYQSPSVERVTGRRPEELVGARLLDLVHPDDLAVARDALLRAAASPGAAVGPFEFRVRHADGTWRVVESTGRSLLDDPEIRGIVINSREVTDRKRAEEALRESEERLRQAMKMEAVGRLAGGVAHDFNNMLTAINGHGEMLREALPPDSPLRRDADEILRAGKRAADLTRHLLAFSRKQVLQPRALDLNEVIRGIESMLRRLIGEDVAIVASPAPDLAPVMADPGQIEQIVLNLAVNARDAMPGGGTLTLSTANVEIGEDRAPDLSELSPGSWVVLAVRDTGHGMDEATLSRVFEPFFTTKEFGQGTGLGLSTVYGIVKQSGGHVTARSAPGEGATFTVYLPRASEAPSRAEEEAAPRAAGGPETVLVVEDERAVRTLVAEILETNGYSILQAGDAEEALRIADAHPGEIDLLFSDVVMPGMNGPALAVRMRAIRPSIEVLFTSGYAEEPSELRGIVEKGAGFLPKPFTLSELTRKVREVLDGRRRR